VTILAMLAYAGLLAGFGVLLVASAAALRDGIRRRGRLRGVLISGAALALSLLGIVALLI
jgi:hypothetical protein